MVYNMLCFTFLSVFLLVLNLFQFANIRKNFGLLNFTTKNPYSLRHSLFTIN